MKKIKADVELFDTESDCKIQLSFEVPDVKNILEVVSKRLEQYDLVDLRIISIYFWEDEVKT